LKLRIKRLKNLIKKQTKLSVQTVDKVVEFFIKSTTSFIFL